MFGWQGITEFVAVVESESFTTAAQQLAISTAQVSRQVSALENRLSTKLLYRTTRKVSVTEAGQLYYQHCRQLLDGVKEAEQALVHLQSKPQGILKITAPNAYGEQHVIPLINDFMSQHSALSVDCQLTNEQVDLINEGFDLAIRVGKLTDSSLVAKRLASRKLITCCSPDYIAQYGKPENISTLNTHQCLQGTLPYWRFQETNSEKSIRIKGRLHCNSGLALLDASLKGIGIVQLPDYYVDDAIQQGLLVQVLEQYTPVEEGIWAVYPQNRHLSPKVRMFVDYLDKHFQQ